LEYGLGRPFSFTDTEFENDAFVKVSDKDFAVKEFIHAIIFSLAFQTK